MIARIELLEVSGEFQLQVYVPKGLTAEMLASISSLLAGSTTCVEIEDAGRKHKLIISLVEEVETVVPEPKGSRTIFRASLTRNSLECVNATCEQVHRTGLADVDHLDIQVDFVGTSSYLTFFFPDHKPPMSSDEARRLLGLA